MSDVVQCPACGKEVFDIDVRCNHCGAPLGATGAHKLLGQVMLGHYELVDVLGQGGMSVVFKGKHKMTDQEVALKILPPELAAHSQVKSRFLDEAKALAALDHPNIVHLYNFGEENGSFVLAMQYVQGRTWERLILEHKKLDWRVSCRICVDVLRALEYAHGRGVVHRDMKPSNVLVRAHDGSATVMDFGIAKMTTSTRLTATGQTMGTVRYMSPEQVRGQEVDLKTDIYSLGATLYESLTGDTPFDGQTHFEIMTKHLSDLPTRPSLRRIEVPPDVEDALMRSLAKRAEDRFDSARDMRKILEAALRIADPGLVETQKLHRDLLGEIPARTTKPGPSPTSRPATASDLADTLEPGTGRAAKHRKSIVPWVVLGLLIAGIATVATLIVLKKSRRDTPAVKPGPFPTLTLEPAKPIDGLVIVTDGAKSADTVAKVYGGELEQMQKLLDHDRKTRGKPAVALPNKVRELYAVPQSALCIEHAYITTPPPECKTDSYALTIGDRSEEGRFQTEPRLYLVSSRLTEAVRGGIAQQACDYLDHADLVEICDFLKTAARDK